jgi:hypothetical protein
MRLVPKFEDAFKETLVKIPTKIPDRRYLELYESHDLNFIGRPFQDMERSHEANVETEGILNFLKAEAHSNRSSLHDRGHQGRKALQEIRVTQEIPGSQETPGSQEIPGSQGQKARQGHRGREHRQAHLLLLQGRGKERGLK